MGKPHFLPWRKKKHSAKSGGFKLEDHRRSISSSHSSSSSIEAMSNLEKEKQQQELQIAATVSLIEKHLSSRNEETPWDQEFSSMSSCRSDGDSKVLARQIVLRTEDDDDDEQDELPPLLRNPHVAEFDIVEVEDEEDEPAAAAVSASGSCETETATRSCSSWSTSSRARRKGNHSFSASLPCEIKGVVAQSIPLVKYSYEPYMDFRVSMLEMIQEEELYVWSDLEELLYCYLSLNSPDQHEVIKQSFADVWHELNLRTPHELD